MIRKTLLVISLLLFMPIMGACVRSYWVSDVVSWSGRHGDLTVVSNYGGIDIWHSPRPPQLEHPQWLLDALGETAASMELLFDGRENRMDHDAHDAMPNFYFGEFRFGWQRNGRSTLIWLQLWLPVALLATYPAVVFARGPLRRYQRRRRNLCLTCGYNLTGNTSGVCSECGTAVSVSSDQAE